MYSLKFIIGDSTELEIIKSNIIPRKEDVVVLKSGNYKVLGIAISYITDEILVYLFTTMKV
jgi:hypothetical protein